MVPYVCIAHCLRKVDDGDEEHAYPPPEDTDPILLVVNDDEKQQVHEDQSESDDTVPAPQCFCSFCHGDTEFEDDNVG